MDVSGQIQWEENLALTGNHLKEPYESDGVECADTKKGTEQQFWCTIPPKMITDFTVAVFNFSN